MLHPHLYTPLRINKSSISFLSILYTSLLHISATFITRYQHDRLWGEVRKDILYDTRSCHIGTRSCLVILVILWDLTTNIWLALEVAIEIHIHCFGTWSCQTVFDNFGFTNLRLWVVSSKEGIISPFLISISLYLSINFI